MSWNRRDFMKLLGIAPAAVAGWQLKAAEAIAAKPAVKEWETVQDPTPRHPPYPPYSATGSLMRSRLGNYPWIQYVQDEYERLAWTFHAPPMPLGERLAITYAQEFLRQLDGGPNELLEVASADLYRMARSIPHFGTPKLARLTSEHQLLNRRVVTSTSGRGEQRVTVLEDYL